LTDFLLHEEYGNMYYGGHKGFFLSMNGGILSLIQRICITKKRSKEQVPMRFQEAAKSLWLAMNPLVFTIIKGAI